VAPSTKTSFPGRLLAALAVLIIVMLAGVLQGDIIHPAKWHDSFKVALGLDLSSGTTVTLKAVPPHGHAVPSSGEMSEAISIMEKRVNSAGFTGAQVQQQGSQLITVSVPGEGAQRVVALVGTTAQLRFRQVLLCSGFSTQCAPLSAQNGATPSPSASPSSSASPSASGSATASSSAKASSSANAGSTASPSPGSSSGGSGQDVSARKLAAAPAAAASATPSSSASAKASSSPSAPASGAPSPSVSASAPATSTTTGDPSQVSKSTMALFNKLNCSDSNWQQKIYGANSGAWDNPKSQIVACDNGGIKYVLATSPVTGTQLTSAAAALDSSNQWVVNFNLNSQGGKAFANLTTQMFNKYYDSTSGAQTSVLDQFAIVLDGKVVSAPSIQQPITGAQGQITGGGSGFSQGSATQLANVLKYGHLPLTFQKQSVLSVSPELGSAQLEAALIAAAVGLGLVVIYSFLYYRGLGIVSVSSLIVAGLVSYVSVVLLSKYEGLTLDLAGVAGLIVSIGITADSFVVYFERLRDEVREGRSLRAAVERGWARARRTILVADTVSFLAALLLYILAIGEVKGFAFTLGLTTLVDVVVVFLFTKPMVTLLARTKFYGQGHRLSGLDPTRLGARSPWRGSRRTPVRPAAGGTSRTSAAGSARTSAKEF
jgi:preprotein translocase subunit SecD